MTLAPETTWLLGATLIVYVVGLYALAFRIRGRIRSIEDFVVAGRRLNVALAGMLNLFFGLDMKLGIVVVAVVAVGYTLMGGMWSVTLTDAFQIVLVFAGLLVLGATTLSTLGEGSYFAEPWTTALPIQFPAAISVAALSFIVYIGVQWGCTRR